MGKAVKKVVDCYGLGWSEKQASQYLEILAPNSNLLDTLREHFRNLQNHCRIASFYEQLPYGNLGVVSGHLLQTKHETAIIESSQVDRI